MDPTRPVAAAVKQHGVLVFVYPVITRSLHVTTRKQGGGGDPLGLDMTPPPQLLAGRSQRGGGGRKHL